jgi:hypothetical protein
MDKSWGKGITENLSDTAVQLVSQNFGDPNLEQIGREVIDLPGIKPIETINYFNILEWSQLTQNQE